MSHIPVLEKASALWNKDQIRVLVMTSLTMQILLILFAPLRKRHGNKLLLFLLWLVYVGADYVATLALGIILTHTKHNKLGGHSGVDLVALWAPFLLLHLGGPDNITSYSLEDNELWLRHFLGFAVQVSVALMVLVLSNMQSTKLLVPSILIFVIGVIKFGERTLALRTATIERLRDSIKKDFPRRRHHTLENCNLTDRGNRTDEEVIGLSDADFICRGKVSFFTHGCHMVSIPRYSRHFYWNWNARAFETIAIELSFFYDILHTKATLIHCRIGRVLRLASLVSISIALIFFHISEKWGHDSSDIIITYILLSMALFLDIYSLLLLVASNWTIVALVSLNKKWSRNLAEFICKAKNRGKKRVLPHHMGQYSLIQTYVRSIRDKHLVWWRHSLSMILYSFKSAWQFLFGDKQSPEVLGILEKLMNEYVKNLLGTDVEGSVRDNIHCSDLARKVRSSWIVETLNRYDSDLSESKNLMREKSFDECVIAWHMATEICYLTSNDTSDGRDTEQCRMSEAIYRVSKYMMHLLLERSSMMPQGFAKERMEATLAQYFCLTHFDDVTTIDAQGTSKFLLEERSKFLEFGIQYSVGQLISLLLGDLTKIDVVVEILDATGGSEQLDNCSATQWEVIGHAWMEMLTYAALNCSPMEHVRTLSRGGELLTYHWLLLLHNYNLEE